MALIDRLERKYGRLAVPGLVFVLVGFQAVVWLMTTIQPGFLSHLLLHRSLLGAGELWRLITWTFIPAVWSPIAVFFMVWVMVMIGRALEAEWGAFRVNLYLLGGIVAQVVGALVFGSVPSSAFLYTTLFLAFAMLFPDRELLLFFILPVKIKYLGMISGALVVLSLISAKSTLGQVSIVCGMLNFLVTFGPGFFKRMGQRTKVSQRRAEFQTAVAQVQECFHRCEDCGKTDVTDPKLEFRVTAEDMELCVDCLAKRKEVKERVAE